jgi:hypothetical protein
MDANIMYSWASNFAPRGEIKNWPQVQWSAYQTESCARISKDRMERFVWFLDFKIQTEEKFRDINELVFLK